jgi:peptidoglycan/LPS O-acetylase OafA/YrhL
MTELILNLVWAAIAIMAIVLAPRRDRRTLAALACVIALLFPIISVSDDLHADATLFETLAAILSAVCVFFALVAMARVQPEPRIKPAFALIVHADPRSPPRR